MNKPLHPQRPHAETSPPFELDGYGWANWQARLIRERRFDALDVENIAEDIESAGKSERSSGESALRVLMLPILEWQYQPDRRGRSWAGSIEEQRLAFEQVMAENPSLKSALLGIRDRADTRARAAAEAEPNRPLATFPLDPPAWEVILGQPFEYEPA